MSEALCGPSNAVQNLAKQSSVDRTLQQDRLVSRQPLPQGFRSHDAHVPSLDSEFEVFQNGQALSAAPAFAGPSWAAPSLSSFASHPPSQAASSGPSSAWTQDFQRLNISSSQQTPTASAPQVWHNHFAQHAQQPTPSYTPSPPMQPLSARFQSPLAFNSMHSAASHYASQSHRTQQQAQLPQDHFDEAAFEAAFDAAMEDASMHQDSIAQDDQLLHEIDSDAFHTDIYPHLPLFRLALANALVTNTDESLHRAAKIVGALIQHPQTMDPVQAMLFRPLLSALNDPKRTLFAQRYGYEPALHEMLDRLAQQTDSARLDIDATTERLLASYADLLWQRNESNHLQPTSTPSSTDNAYWLDRFYDEDSVPVQNITLHSANLLVDAFDRQVVTDPQSQALNRVLDLEYDVYSKRHTVPDMPRQHPASSQEREAMMFSMMEHILKLPETVEALDTMAPSNASVQQPSTNHALQDYHSQLDFLEQNRARLLKLQMQQEQQDEMIMNMQHSEDISSSPVSHDAIFEDTSEIVREQTEQQRQEQWNSDRQNDDALAETAAHLLERVSDNQTSKFKNSAFLGLMRQLAHREIRVEGDKMVPTNASGNALDSTPLPVLAAQDGQEVVDLLKQPGSLTDQDPEFMMTSPFTSADDF